MNWRTHAAATNRWLRVQAAVWAREHVKDLQVEWRSRPLIRHLSALALCLLVALVGVLERSTKRASIAKSMTSMERTVVAPQTSPRGAAVAKGRLTALNRSVPTADRG
jgi:hypothetical protein